MMRWKLFLAILAGLLIISLFSLPYLAEWYLEKNDQEILGREIEIEDIDLNIFTGKLALEGLQVFGEDMQRQFLSCQNAEIRLSWWQLFSDNIHIRLFRLDELKVNIIQNGKHFNFDDLLSPIVEDSIEKPSKTYRWQLDSVLLANSALRYQDVIVGSKIDLDSINISSGSLSSENPSYQFDTHFMMQQGTLAANLYVDTDQSLYVLKSKIDQLSFASLQPYLNKFMKLSAFDSQLDGDILLSGNYVEADSFALKGNLHVRDFIMIDQQEDSLMAWADFAVEIDSLNTRQQIYDFGNVSMNQPYIRLVVTPEGNNFTFALADSPQDSLSQTDSLSMQLQTDTLSEDNYISPFEYIAESLYELTQEYLAVNYLADSISIEGGVLEYYDYTLEDSFYMELSDLSALATDIKEEDEYTKFNIRSRLDQSGNMVADLQISRKRIDNMIFDFKLDNVYLSTFNPYSKYYMAHPFADGKVIFSSKNKIENYFLTSSNNLFVEHIAVGDKDTANALYELPMKLAVALLRDLQGNVDLDVPVEGQLNDPEYKLWRTILQVLRNIILKVVTAPYRLLANAIGGDPKDLKSVSFDPLQYDVQQQQAKSLKSIAKVLKQKPEFKACFVSISDSIQEKSALALRETWADYQSSMGMVSQDSLNLLPSVNSLDSAFYQFVQQSVAGFDTITTTNVLGACMEYTGKVRVDTLYQQLWKKRTASVHDYLLEVEALPVERWLFTNKAKTTSDSSNVHPHFLVEYEVE